MADVKEKKGFVVVLVLICRLVIGKESMTKEATEMEGCLAVVAILRFQVL